MEERQYALENGEEADQSGNVLLLAEETTQRGSDDATIKGEQ